MIRINELRLPLNHPEEALRPAIVSRLGIKDAQLTSFTVFKRSYDARKKAAMVLIYSIDCELENEQAVLKRLEGDVHVKPSPDTSYKFVGHAPADFHASGRPRPVIIGFGPCGIFAALILAQMGLRPIVLERSKRCGCPASAATCQRRRRRSDMADNVGWKRLMTSGVSACITRDRKSVV